jgi:membrane-bound lytic murein transglycosylase D
LWNQLRGNQIAPGQQLAIYQTLPGGESEDESSSTTQASAVEPKDKAKVPQPASLADQPANSRIIHFYTVRPGDTLWTISQKYDGVSVKDIMKTNRIRQTKSLKPGTTLKIVMDV